MVKYPKISVDGYIFPNFVSVSTDIGYIVNISAIYSNILIPGSRAWTTRHIAIVALFFLLLLDRLLACNHFLRYVQVLVTQAPPWCTLSFVSRKNNDSIVSLICFLVLLWHNFILSQVNFLHRIVSPSQSLD